MGLLARSGLPALVPRTKKNCLKPAYIVRLNYKMKQFIKKTKFTTVDFENHEQKHSRAR